MGKVINKAEVAGKKSMAETRKIIIKARNKSKDLKATRSGIQDITKTTFKPGEKTIKNAKKVAQANIKAVKLEIAGAEALVSALIAMGWVAVIVIIICCLFGAAFYFFGDNSSSEYTPVSKEVEAYEPLIRLG